MSRYAAIDIGSNSIRMLTAEVLPGMPMLTLAADRQVVRLGSGVFREGRLSRESIALAYQVLARMADTYQRLGVLAVRAVGTAALRDATNQEEFLGRASAILGVPVEVISGLEEARLIHLGVQSRWPHPDKRILIVDIGGGSAELILSENGQLTQAYSKPLGAVRMTEMFLKSDPADAKELARMKRHIQERLMGPVQQFQGLKFDRMIATSATAAATVCSVNQVGRTAREDADKTRASAAQVRLLFQELAGKNQAKRAKITGIGPRRAEIIVAGVGVLSEILDSLKLPSVYYSTAGVRDGIVADLAHRKVGMEQSRLDADQLRVMRDLGKRYGMDGRHVKKVAELASSLYHALSPLHKLPQVRGKVLEAAGYLYNIGHFINEAKHHRHSMYVVANSDLPGFEDRERGMIANLCRYHRKSLPQTQHEQYQMLLPEDRRTVLLLTPLLRLAVALDQSQEQRVEKVDVKFSAKGVELQLIAKGDADLEQWQSAQAAGVFQEIFGIPLTVRIAK